MSFGSFDNDDEVMSEINMTPLVDVMLVLLIIFMVAAPLATVDVPVDLPSSTATAKPQDEAPIYLTVRADRSLRLNDDPVDRSHLKAALDRLSHGDPGERVYLRADKTVSYDVLMATMDALRDAGYLKVALVGLEHDHG